MLLSSKETQRHKLCCFLSSHLSRKSTNKKLSFIFHVSASSVIKAEAKVLTLKHQHSGSGIQINNGHGLFSPKKNSGCEIISLIRRTIK